MNLKKKKIVPELPSLVNMACERKDFSGVESSSEFSSGIIVAAVRKALLELLPFEGANTRIDDAITDGEAGKIVIVIKETGEIFIKTEKQPTPYYDKCTLTSNISAPSCGSGLITYMLHAGRDVLAYAWNTNVTSRPSDLKQQTHLYNNEEDEISERKKRRRKTPVLSSERIAKHIETENTQHTPQKHTKYYGK